jgi:hexokinase
VYLLIDHVLTPTILARTKYDIIIDESSNKPGEQSFEKMIAGLYLGEVFRLVLVEMIDAGELFLGQNTYKMEKAYAMDTAFLSLMERYVLYFLRIPGMIIHFFSLVTRRTSFSVSSVSSPTSSVSKPRSRNDSSSDLLPS